jgi:two-component system, OmpR family, sensor histidine kinase ChvG
MLSIHSMELDTDSRGDIARWFTLTRRILAVNIFAVLLLAGSLFYIDSFRERLIDERMAQAQTDADLIASALSQIPQDQYRNVLTAMTSKTEARLRVFDARGVIQFDSWTVAPPRFRLINPDTEIWQRSVARRIDDTIDWIVDAEVLLPFKTFDEASPLPNRLLLAPDHTHIISSSRVIAGSSASEPQTLRLDRNARDIRRLVRAERTRLGLIMAFVAGLSTLLSIFLARTIAVPLKNLARAAQQVRLGRAREVIVPRLPSRGDEIGELARALSDMSGALQARIDATEQFAADVTHEIKNPLASLSSAAQTLPNVKTAAARRQLVEIISDDVSRLNRLITDISDLSRLDSQLARTTFETVDIGSLIETLIAVRIVRYPDMAERIAFARPKTGSTLVRGDGDRLARVFENLLDNAVSFSPANGVINLAASKTRDRVIISIEDEGPGVPASARTRIFERFHTDRAGSETFGVNSGLGLSIAKAIIEGHDGTIKAETRGKGRSGARFVITLPAQRS